MSTFGNIVFGLGGIVHSLITIYIWIVIIAALITWVRPDPNNPIVQLLYRLTEPVYAFIRRYIPTVINGIDLTPIVVIIGLQVIDVIFINLLNALASSMIRLLALMLIAFQLGAVTLDEIRTKPASLAKNFLIWQYFQQNISSEEADSAFYQIRDVNRKLFLAYAKKSRRPEVIYTAHCMKLPKKELLYAHDRHCAMIAFSTSKAAKMTLKQRTRLARLIDDNATRQWVEMMNDTNLSEHYPDYTPKLFLKLFNQAGAQFRHDNFDLELSESYVNSLAASPGFSRSLILAVTDEKMRRFQKSLLKTDGNLLNSHSNFYLGLNHLNHADTSRAIDHFQRAYDKAYYRSDQDKALFWQYLAGKNELILKKLSQRIDININSLYAKEKMKIWPDNYFIDLSVSQKKSKVDLSDPFDWNSILNEIKKTPKAELYDLAQHYDAKNLIPVQSFIVERASGSKLHGFIMPYEHEMKELSKDDQALYYALMRQESRFVPAALSRSFALGLMQLMPFLVKALDKEIDYKRNSLSDMFDPAVNLMYATTHIKWLQYRVYHPLFIAYAYNGGIGFTKRHLLKGTFQKGAYEPFMSMELMVNTESREYGKKVLSNYVIYKKILGEPISIADLFDSLTQPSQTDRFRGR